MSLEIGQIYEVMPEYFSVCGTFEDTIKYNTDTNLHGKYIKITDTRDGEIRGYEILNKDKKRLNGCGCLRIRHLIPLKSEIPKKKVKIEYVALYQEGEKTRFETMKNKVEFVKWVQVNSKDPNVSNIRIIKAAEELRVAPLARK